MLSFSSNKDAVEFYQKAKNYAKKRKLSKELAEDFSSWALLAYNENRSRMDYLLIDFLRQQKSAEEFCEETSASDDWMEEKIVSKDFMQKLPSREQKILFSYFWEGKSFEEISLSVEVSKERVRQLLNKSIEMLRVS